MLLVEWWWCEGQDWRERWAARAIGLDYSRVSVTLFQYFGLLENSIYFFLCDILVLILVQLVQNDK